MRARIAVLADAANVSREGKLNILGLFEVIWAATLPVTWPLMHLVLSLEATSGEGVRHKVGVRVIDEDGKIAGPVVDAEGDFIAPRVPGLPPRVNLILGIAGAKFEKHGTYTFEILVDGHNVESISLHVLQPPQPPKPGLPAGA